MRMQTYLSLERSKTLEKEELEARIEELEHMQRTQGLRDAAQVELENSKEMLRMKEKEEQDELKKAIERAKEQGDGDLFEHPKKKKSEDDEFYDFFTSPKRSEY